jgi:tetratricopeptide (TPR) repeat protein
MRTYHGRESLFARIVLLLLISSAALIAPRTANADVAAQEVSQKNPGRQPTPAEAEVQKRLARVEQAKSSGNAVEVARASEQLIALVLREMGQLRLLEAAPQQAVSVYKQSLEFENAPETRVDLAIAYLQSKQPDACIREADTALLDDPNNARAFNALGRAWLAKGDYPNAIRSLSRAVELAPEFESLYYLGTSLLATHDAADKARAPQVFEQMVKLVGDSGSLHVMFGRAYRDGDDLPAAIREFQRAIEMDPGTPHAHYFLGLARMAANEWVAAPESRAEFHKELEFYPRDYLANYMLGFIAASDRRYEESDRYLNAAVSIRPEAPDPWLYLGLNAFAQGNMKRAEETFRKAIELTGEDDSRSNYQIRRAYIDLGRILTTSGRKEEAEPYLVRARELQNKVLQTSQEGMASHMGAEAAGVVTPVIPAMKEAEEQNAPVTGMEADPFAHVDPSALAVSNLTDKQKQQAAAEEKQFRAILAQSYGDLGTSEAIRKDYASALRYYQEAAHWDAEAPGLMRNIGLSAFRGQNYPEAVRGLSAAVERTPNDAAARAMLGMAYFAEDKYKDAVKTFTPLGDKGMQDAAVGYAWAASLTRLGDLEAASKVLQEFEKGDRPNETRMLIGQLWIEIADYARAVAAFDGVLQNDPAWPKAHYFAGQAYLRWEHWNEAASEFHAELQRIPEDADARYNLGFVYLQQGKPAEAEQLFEQVIASHPEHANAQYEMGKILLERGEIADAVTHLEAAARLSPQTDYVHYQLQAAYRKEGRTGDADRELELYKNLKAKQRQRASAAVPPQTP